MTWASEVCGSAQWPLSLLSGFALALVPLYVQAAEPRENVPVLSESTKGFRVLTAGVPGM